MSKKETFPEVLSFKPHHFLCTLGFEGKGYSSKFTDNFSTIKAFLESEERETHPLRVTSQSDVICFPCPHRRKNLCEAQAKVQKLDDAHLEALSLQEEDILTWKEAKEKIRQHVTMDVFHTICAPCEWKKFRFCEKALTTLLQEKSSF